MADLTQEQMLEMARVAGLLIPDEDGEHLTIRLNALLEASTVLDQYPLEDLKALPSLAHPFELPSRQREAGRAPSLTVESDAPLAYKPITELAHLIRTKQLSPVELTNLYLERIGHFDGELKSYISVLPEIARREAEEAERALVGWVRLGAAARYPLGLQGRVLHQGCPHYLRVAHPL